MPPPLVSHFNEGNCIVTSAMSPLVSDCHPKEEACRKSRDIRSFFPPVSLLVPGVGKTAVTNGGREGGGGKLVAWVGEGRRGDGGGLGVRMTGKECSGFFF
jgi:hypothetical protein